MTRYGLAILAALLAPLAATALAATAGDAAAPPIRLGLWEITSTTTLTGALPVQLPPAQAEQLRRLGVPVPGLPTTRTDHACIDQRSIEHIGEPEHDRSCHRANVMLSDRGLSADIVCDGDGAHGHGHIDISFDDTTHLHGALQIKGSAAAAPGITRLDAGLQGHWLGAQCGSSKPL